MTNLIYAELELPLELPEEKTEDKQKKETVAILELSPSDNDPDNQIQI